MYYRLEEEVLVTTQDNRGKIDSVQKINADVVANEGLGEKIFGPFLCRDSRIENIMLLKVTLA